MRIFKSTLILIALLSVFSGGACVSVLAEEGNVTYSGNAGSFIFEPGSEFSPTDLFADFKNVMPGASISQTVTIKNNAGNNKKIKIFLRSLGATDDASAAFLNQLRLTVELQEATPLFDAAADQTAGLTDWVCLGTLYSKDAIDLNMILEVPNTLDNSYQKQEGKFRWQFAAQEFDLETPKHICTECSGTQNTIKTKSGLAQFVCEECGNVDDMLCAVCGGKMQQGIILILDGKSYTTYPYGTEDDHYVTKDGSLHLYLNDIGILACYSLNGKRIDLKGEDKFDFYTFYVCVDNDTHHTEPISPQTGIRVQSHLWICGMVIFVLFLLMILLLFKGKRRNERK